MRNPYLNKLLFRLLGDTDLVERWWTTPNGAFGMVCPQNIDENLIKSYLEGYYFG